MKNVVVFDEDAYIAIRSLVHDAQREIVFANVDDNYFINNVIDKLNRVQKILEGEDE